MRRLLASVLLVLVALGCGESNSPPGNSAADAAKPNACGGELSLTFLGRPASPSDPCGACVNGALVCASPNALACLGSGTSCGDGGMNACGGPKPLVVDGRP